jgi:hypothetical protein
VLREIERRKAVQREAERRKQEARGQQEKYYNRGKKEREFKEGDRVMVRDNTKVGWFQDKREGPYRVEKKLERNNYLLFDYNRHRWLKRNVESIVINKLDEVDEHLKREESKKFREEGKGLVWQKKQQKEVEKEEGPIEGKRVSVWFEDKKKEFRGVVRRKEEGENYEVEWENKKEGREIVDLKRVNLTSDKSNTERWRLILPR